MEKTDKILNKLCLTRDQAKKIHFKYYLLYENRLSVVNKSTINKTFKHIYEHSFKPEISFNSQKYASITSERRRTRSSLGVSTDLYQEREKLAEKQEELRKKFEKMELEKCTFKPEVKSLPKSYQKLIKTDKASQDYRAAAGEDRNLSLYNYANVALNKREKSIRTIEEQEVEKVRNELTFKPKLIPREETDEVPDEKPGVKDMITRLQTARKYNENINRLKEKGCTMNSQVLKSFNIQTQKSKRQKKISRPPAKNPDKGVKDSERKPNIPKPPLKKRAIVDKFEINAIENLLNNSGSSLENGNFPTNEVIYEDEEMENISEEADGNFVIQEQESTPTEEYTESSEDENENLNIEIKMGDDKIEILTLVKGVNRENTVKEFAERFELAPEAEAKILELVLNLPNPDL